jgi:D-alanyl-D-alanine-carboxypeptidase/D-alanyl-D-alanine-endopeptidase
MSLHRLAACLLLATATLSSPARCAEPFTMQSDPNSMASHILGERKGAAAVGVWKNGAASYGTAARDVKADPALLFEIGSISKVFTGLLLAQAVERGELALDDNLGKLLQGEVALSPEVAAVTLRQLITHSSCLPRLPANFPDLLSKDPYRNYDRAMMWAALADLKLPKMGPCEGAYSNLGVAVVGEILSRRYGKPWETLVRENITGPLGMRDTVQHLGDKARRLAPAWAGAEPTPPWDFVAFAGAGSLRSSAADMLVFSRALMAGKNGPLGAAGVRVLQPLGSFGGGDIGYAIMMRGPAEKRTYMHGGGTGGFRSEWLLMPDRQEALIAMASNNEANPGAISGDILALRYLTASGAVAVNPAVLPDYAGVFRVNASMAFTFVAEGGVLHGRITGQRFSALTAAAPDVFTFPSVGAEFGFSRENGKVAGVTLRQRGAEMKAVRVAEPSPAKAYDPALTQEAFGGDYLVAASPSPMKFVVQAGNGQLGVRLNEQQMLPVFAVPGKADRYAVDVVAAEYQFERDVAGKVAALVLHQNGMAIRAERQAPPAK